MIRAAFWAVTALSLLGAVPAAGVPASGGEEPFTFKRIAAPKPGTQKRILVQIDPAEQAARLASMPPWPEVPKAEAASAPTAPLPLPDTGLPALKPGAYDWYWSLVSPNLGDSAGRFSLALDSLTKGPGGATVAAPRMQALQDIAATHGAEILQATVGTDVSPALVLAVISIESAGNPQAVSHAGAVGLMQLIPATADRFGVADSRDPMQNIRGGVAYLDWLMKEFDHDPVMVLAAYNSGENTVKDNRGVPPIAETRDYVPKVLAAWAVARSLCMTPPELVTDGCVFTAPGQAL
ncbi:MAG: lytic transglycosylase domain-containing protein [Proteobacteria bacterium]|nr:lytic transglycosylase domain-containing protein [Pseudomonadota bacterium]MBS0574394.1 lytic transglycosylase domain-containing protein [Pseudomonadota bacterium]